MWKDIANSLENFQYTVWTEFTPLALKHQAINLGQGFPNFACPQFVKDALTEAVNNNENQYSRPAGFPMLVEEIAKIYSVKHNRKIDPMTEVAVCYGASEALFNVSMALINPGDEVIVIDPSFDIYIPQICIPGGIPIRVSLEPPVDDVSPWTINFDKLEAAFNNKTKILLFNTPNNPIGKIFTREELERIAQILEKWPNVAIVADEVYEHIVFDGREHISLADIGNLWERSVTLSSAGKLFSITGWKTGWAVGGPLIIKNMVVSKLWTSFCSNTVCQGAIARCLRFAENEYEGFPNYYKWLSNQYEQKRERIKNILSNSNVVKIQPLLSEGGFFLVGRILDDGDFIPDRYKQGATLDFAFCRWLTEEYKVSAIPCSAFFGENSKHYGTNLVRFALCKEFSDYDKTEKILIRT
ncbi:hypothetical protein SteCoe_24753 [Stentor coeruleus]|uniref:Aminotransferase class I/classII large domain-containing protein n=1 Tax=Stentor coeruleus TaxID=5963 RepID=A0A1R2BGW4_9CILI|nr:hypothetical protein SteCoe_24753 [Stentor coeruleus]